MYDQESLLDMPNYEENLIFYKVMNYPIPTQLQYFLFEKSLNPQPTNTISHNSFSRHKQNPFMHDYIQYINKF